MMDYQDEMKSVTVRVANGSGVIMQPLANDYFYILTAHHVVEGKKKDNLVLDFQSSSSFHGKSVIIRDIIEDEELDVAILIIEGTCDDIAHFYPSNIHQNGIEHWHAGYPNNQNDKGKADNCKLHDFNIWLGSYGQHFVEYKYPNHIRKEELDGMSGGGIFDSQHHLIGLHKGLAANEEKEQLGKNVMIPLECFESIIVDRGLSSFAPRKFDDIKKGIFNFEDNLGAKAKLHALLLHIAQFRADILELSPQLCYDSFQKSRNANVYKQGSELQEEDCVKFGEFMVALKTIWGIDVCTHLEEAFPRFQFVQSPIDFDIYEAPKHLDPSLLGVVDNTDVVFVVGGISSKGYKQDVRHKDVTDIAVGIKADGKFNIARTGRESLGIFTYVNSHFFKDAMLDNTDEIRDCEEDKMEFYKYLINSKI